MNWKILRAHFIHYANELEAIGHEQEADYIREKLLPKLKADEPQLYPKG